MRRSWFLFLLAAPALAESPVVRLNDQEDDNDRLEVAFDALCSSVKEGRRDSALPVTELAWVTACSLRALKLDPVVQQRQAAHVLWEVEGRRATGERVSQRGEADVVLNRSTGVVIETWTDTWREQVARAEPRFVERAEETGLTLSGLESPRVESAEYNAGGLSVRDVTGDGVPEVFTIESNQVVRFDRVSAAPLRYQRSVLYQWPKRVLATSILGGDVDGDGDVDLLLTAYPASVPVVLRNEGASFEPVPLPKEARGDFVASVLSDFDGDGDLDVALLPYDLASNFPRDLLEAPNGLRPVMLRGAAGATFKRWPTTLTRRWVLAGVAADLLNEGGPQLYLANDFGSNDLYAFLPDGGAVNRAVASGVDDPGNGMSADVGDFDGDGALDLAVANMFSKAGTRVLAATKVSPKLKAKLDKFARGNTLYLSRDGGFVEVATEQGVNRGLWAFATLMTDVDDDGRLDVAVANGYISRPNRKDL
jgi:hypothetical protein